MISVVCEEYPVETLLSRLDFACVCNSPLVEQPYWFVDDKGREFHGIFACIGWPQEVTERNDQLPGYAAIVGVSKDAAIRAEDARFVVLDEVAESSEMLLLRSADEMRRKWGFGVHPKLMRYFWGDYRTMESVVSRFNAEAIERDGDDTNAVIITPPDDFDNQRSFDIYVGTLRTVLSPKAKRLYVGAGEIIKNRLLSFRRGDPAIIALGGLVHTLLLRTLWMEQTNLSAFEMPDE